MAGPEGRPFGTVTPPFNLGKDNYESVRHLMVDQWLGWEWPLRAPKDRSFRAAMEHVTAIDPELILLTYKSAIPVADAVRGYYDELGTEAPELGFIHANSAFAEYPDLYADEIEREIHRLEPIVSGARVGVIDQYTWTGQTLRLAVSMAERANALETASPESTNWYHNAHRWHVRVGRMTSIHAEQMHAIGAEAARRSLARLGEMATTG